MRESLAAACLGVVRTTFLDTNHALNPREDASCPLPSFGARVSRIPAAFPDSRHLRDDRTLLYARLGRSHHEVWHRRVCGTISRRVPHVYVCVGARIPILAFPSTRRFSWA